jgi:hypothetical protein
MTSIHAVPLERYKSRRIIRVADSCSADLVTTLVAVLRLARTVSGELSVCVYLRNFASDRASDSVGGCPTDVRRHTTYKS